MNSAFQTPTEKRCALEAILLAHPGTSCAAQCQRLLAALCQFGITSFEGTRYLDAYCTRARIAKLRKDGHRITTHWRVIETESGERHRVGLYVLTMQAEAPHG